MAGESVRHSPSAEAEPLFPPHQRVLWPQEGRVLLRGSRKGRLAQKSLAGCP